MPSLKSFDFFQKSSSTVQVHTTTGGVVTVLTFAVMLVLLLGETVNYFTAQLDEYISVDQSFGEQIEINVDIEFPSSPCRLVFFDVVDSTGEEQLAVDDLTKVPQTNPQAASREGAACTA